MCGLYGYAGQTDDRERLHRFMSALAIETSARGHDATGFAALTENGELIGSKSAVTAKVFVENDKTYAKVWDFDARLFIGHCRLATHGHERENKNNHPHVSKDKQYAIVHNGVVWMHRSLAETANRKLFTDCDSESILRLIESNVPLGCGDAPGRMVDVCQKLEEHGAGFAVLCLDKSRRVVWGFRNYANPLHYWESKALGVTVFASETAHIASAAREVLGRRVARALHKQKLMWSPNPGYVVRFATDGAVEFSERAALCDKQLSIYRNVSWADNRYLGAHAYCGEEFDSWLDERDAQERNDETERTRNALTPTTSAYGKSYSIDHKTGQVKITEQ